MFHRLAESLDKRNDKHRPCCGDVTAAWHGHYDPLLFNSDIGARQHITTEQQGRMRVNSHTGCHYYRNTTGRPAC